MAKYNVALNSARTVTPDIWDFTGRIKYEKFSKRVDIYFEIEYIVEEVKDNFFEFLKFFFTAGFYDTSIYEITKKMWVSEKSFYMYEVPEIKIYNCD